MPVKREILYPIFLECCQFTNDIFWEGIFDELAYGKAPYGTYINKGFICCSYKNKEFTYKIERKDPKILYDNIYNLLTEKLGILSYKEKIRKRLDFHELEKNIKQSRREWTSIRSKNIKDIMYEKYVIDMKRKYSLSIIQCRYLLAVILLSIMFKTITPKDIVYNDDKIQTISGFEFEKGKVIVNRALCSVELENIYDTDNLETKTMSENWEKYTRMIRSETRLHS